MPSRSKLGILAAAMWLSGLSVAPACWQGQTYCSGGTRYVCYCNPPGSTYCDYQPTSTCHHDDADPLAGKASLDSFKSYTFEAESRSRKLLSRMNHL